MTTDPNEAPRMFIAIVTARMRGDLDAIRSLIRDMSPDDQRRVLIAGVELYSQQAAAAGVDPDELAAVLLDDATE